MTLDDWAWIVAASVVPIGGIINRWRGGLALFDLDWKLGAKRVAFSVATMLYAVFVWAVVAERLPGADLAWFVPWMALAFWPGLCIPWGRFMDLGRVRGDWRVEFPVLCGIGFGVTAPAGAILWWQFGSPWLFWSGLLMGPCYELAWRTSLDLPGVAERGPPWGEVYFGTAIWAAICAGAAIR